MWLSRARSISEIIVSQCSFSMEMGALGGLLVFMDPREIMIKSYFCRSSEI
jgi:hypothetical protein